MERSTYTGTLPGPTASVGLPEEYAARTIAEPPVAITTAIRRWLISSRVPSSVVPEMHWIKPAGAPASSAASDMMRAVSAPQRRPRGCGACTIALPALTAESVLKMTVEVGLVTGISAATTPIGSPIATTLVVSSRHSTPSVRTLRSQSDTAIVLNRFLSVLSAAFPYPVSCAASSPSRAASGAIARAIASTTRSTSAGSKVRNLCQAS